MNPSQKTNLFNSQKICWGLLLVALTIWSYFSYHNWISDSEFWPVTVSREILNLGTTQHPVIFYKPVFHLSLFWLHLLPLDNVQHIQAAKLIFTLVGFFSFVFLFQLTSRIIGVAKALLLILVLFSSALVFSNMGSIRSDMLVTFFILLGLLKWEKVSHMNLKKQTGFWLIWSFAILLTTPKAIYVCLVLFAAYGFLSDRKIYISLIKIVICTVVVTLALISLLYHTGFEVRLYEAFISALRHGIVSQQEFNQTGLNHWLKSYLRYDAGFFISGFLFQIVGIYLGFKKGSVVPALVKSYLLIGLGLLILALFYEPKHLFWVASLVPIWSLSWLYFFEKLQIKYMISFFLILCCMTLMKGKRNPYFYSNDLQKLALQDLSSYLEGRTDTTLLDGIGLLPRSSKKLIYIGPQDEENNGLTLQYILKDKPEYILSTSRVLSITKDLSNLLIEEYESCEMGLLAKKGYCSGKKINWNWQPWSLFGFNSFAREP